MRWVLLGGLAHPSSATNSSSAVRPSQPAFLDLGLPLASRASSPSRVAALLPPRLLPRRPSARLRLREEAEMERRREAMARPLYDSESKAHSTPSGTVLSGASSIALRHPWTTGAMGQDALDAALADVDALGVFVPAARLVVKRIQQRKWALIKGKASAAKTVTPEDVTKSLGFARGATSEAAEALAELRRLADTKLIPEAWMNIVLATTYFELTHESPFDADHAVRLLGFHLDHDLHSPYLVCRHRAFGTVEMLMRPRYSDGSPCKADNLPADGFHGIAPAVTLAGFSHAWQAVKFCNEESCQWLWMDGQNVLPRGRLLITSGGHADHGVLMEGGDEAARDEAASERIAGKAGDGWGPLLMSLLTPVVPIFCSVSRTAAFLSVGRGVTQTQKDNPERKSYPGCSEACPWRGSAPLPGFDDASLLAAGLFMRAVDDDLECERDCPSSLTMLELSAEAEREFHTWANARLPGASIRPIRRIVDGARHAAVGPSDLKAKMRSFLSAHDRYVTFAEVRQLFAMGQRYLDEEPHDSDRGHPEGLMNSLNMYFKDYTKTELPRFSGKPRTIPVNRHDPDWLKGQGSRATGTVDEEHEALLQMYQHLHSIYAPRSPLPVGLPAGPVIRQSIEGLNGGRPMNVVQL